MVRLHVTTSAVLWILILRLLPSTRERLPLPPEPEPVTDPAAAATGPLLAAGGEAVEEDGDDVVG